MIKAWFYSEGLYKNSNYMKKEVVERKEMEFLMTSPAESVWNMQNQVVASILL